MAQQRKRAAVVDAEKPLSEERAIKMSRIGDDTPKVGSFLSAADKRDDADVSTKEDFGKGVIKEDYEKKHTLESDEEEEEKYERLDMNKIEGQEEATEEYDGNTKLTAFNMREEEEEGHFDAMGNFVFDRKGEDIKDAWLDNIDWTRVKRDAGKHWQEETEDESLPVPPVDEVSLLQKVAAFLSEKETVTKALKRLGGNLSAAEQRALRWKIAKEKKAAKGGEVVAEKQSHSVEDLTGLVDQLLAAKHVDIYSYTKERIAREIESRQQSTSKNVADKEVDIFASTSQGDDTAKNDNEQGDGNTMWEYKLSQDADAKVYGPVSTKQMIKWQEEKHFGDNGAWARQVGKADAPFYSTRRIDFELYA